jgi:hypothetical protein
MSATVAHVVVMTGDIGIPDNRTPALLRLSAMISQYFIEPLQFSSSDEFLKRRNLSASFSGLNDRDHFHRVCIS